MGLATAAPASAVLSTVDAVDAGPSRGAALFLPLFLVEVVAVFVSAEGAHVVDGELEEDVPLALDISILLDTFLLNEHII